jgi:phosphatidylglycerol:prolipoprotein diacylglycerol transferase
MVYPDAGPQPRFPSELIEACLEGILLFIILLLTARSLRVRAHAGMLTGMFVTGYGICRIIGECFREPDAFLGFLPFGTTMGQILSLPMIAAGVALMVYANRPRNRAV